MTCARYQNKRRRNWNCATTCICISSLVWEHGGFMAFNDVHLRIQGLLCSSLYRENTDRSEGRRPPLPHFFTSIFFLSRRVTLPAVTHTHTIGSWIHACPSQYATYANHTRHRTSSANGCAFVSYHFFFSLFIFSFSLPLPACPGPRLHQREAVVRIHCQGVRYSD